MPHAKFKRSTPWNETLAALEKRGDDRLGELRGVIAFGLFVVGFWLKAQLEEPFFRSSSASNTAAIKMR